MKPSVTTKLNRFFAEYPLKRFGTGEVILMPSDDVPPVMLVARGKIAQYDVSPSGTKTVLNIFHNPAFFPMLNAVNRVPNAYYYEAISDVRVRMAPPEATVAFLKENPDVMFDLLSRLYSGLEGTLGKMSRLMAGTAQSRLLYELTVLAERFGEKTDETDYKIKVTEVQLAQQTGLARETVSRELQKLKKEGLITLSKGTILVHSSLVLPLTA